ncbi:uncharacterized protein UHOD_11269 [Ustilago sp. UG-2017b]|nr:uncharacterized protein UHOD_11269 [Ustilago sp. UG-2017b]
MTDPDLNNKLDRLLALLEAQLELTRQGQREERLRRAHLTRETIDLSHSEDQAGGGDESMIGDPHTPTLAPRPRRSVSFADMDEQEDVNYEKYASPTGPRYVKSRVDPYNKSRAEHYVLDQEEDSSIMAELNRSKPIATPFPKFNPRDVEIFILEAEAWFKFNQVYEQSRMINHMGAQLEGTAQEWWTAKLRIDRAREGRPLPMLCSPSLPPRPTLSSRVCVSSPRRWVASSARSLISGPSPTVAPLRCRSLALALLASTLSPGLPSSPSSAVPSRLVASRRRSMLATLSVVARPPGRRSTAPPPLTSSHSAGGAPTATTATSTDRLRSAVLWSHWPSSLSEMAPWFPAALPGEIQAWPDPSLLAPDPIETALSCTGASTTGLAGREPPSSSPRLDPRNLFSVSPLGRAHARSD